MWRLCRAATRSAGAGGRKFDPRAPASSGGPKQRNLIRVVVTPQKTKVAASSTQCSPPPPSAAPALGAQLEQLQAAKQDWFVGAGLVDKQGISLEADGAVTVRRQDFDKALRNFPKTDSPSKAKAARKMEVTAMGSSSCP